MGAIMALPIEPATGKVIVITGANRGIGLATVHELQRRGAKVVAGIREPHKMPSIPGVTVLELDVANPDSCRAFVAEAEREHGHIDGLINNAGILVNPDTPVLEMAEDDLRRVLEVNLNGPIRLCQLIVPGMQSRSYGRIVNISSGLGGITDMGGGFCSYRMSKLALNGFTRILAAELGPNSAVKVNSLDPGWVRTDMGGSDATRDPSEPAGEIADLISISAHGPSGGFFRGGEVREW